MAAAWLRPTGSAGPFARDFEAYVAAGATWLAGGDPYGRDVWRIESTIPGVDASHDELLPYVGPAAALPFWSLLARLPFERARIVWEAILVVALGALVGASLVLAGAARTRSRVVLALVLAAVSGPVISAVTLGQAALVGAAAMVLALVALDRRSWWAMPAAFIAAIQPNLALPLAVRALDRRAFALLAGAATAFVALTLAIGGGLAGLTAYLQLLRAHDAAERYITIQHTLPALAAAWGASHARADAIGSAVSLAALAIVAFAALRWRAQPLVATCVAIALLPFAVPFFHEHDFTLDLVPVLVLATRGDGRVRALTGCAAVMVLVDWFGMAQRPSGTVQIACLALAVACAYALLAARDDDAPLYARLTALAPLVTAAVLTAVCLPLAHAFPAPTWPDTLGTYHAAPGAGISAIWAAESVRSGLAAVVPGWSALRAIPLAGCLVLAYASVLLATGSATNTSPLRIASGTPASASPLQGPIVHEPSSMRKRAEW